MHFSTLAHPLTLLQPFSKRARTASSCFFGNKLYVLKPDVHELLNELHVVDISLPEDIERLRTKKKATDISDRLELLDDAVCSSNSIELGWRPPTKNHERIDSYKLMIATATGVVRDVYSGKAQRHRVLGLKPNTEYIFCVKAIYDDASFLWSESKAFSTKA